MSNIYLGTKDGREHTPNQGVLIDIIGESRPFSKYGQSICYHVNVCGYHYLVDCGAPIFEHIPYDHIENINGLLATHSHEDHKRWFTDLALYLKYKVADDRRLNLITTDPIHEEFLKNSRGALERTLSPDSRQVIEVPYEDFVNQVPFGPRPKYRIQDCRDESGGHRWQVVDATGEAVSRDRAKIVIRDRQQANRPRMLFRDPDTSLWVEPYQYYSFDSDVFYHQDWRTIQHESDTSSVTISPVKDPVWHGPPTIGIEIQTPDERVVFSSDTVYDPDLWKELSEERQELTLKSMSKEQFETSRIIQADINDLIQKQWSKQRRENALEFYEDAVVIHDCGPTGDPVHTDYAQLQNLDCEQLVLTHCPDRFISEYPIAVQGKTFLVRNNELLEKNQNGKYPVCADTYVRDSDSAYVGFENENGAFTVVRRNGSLDIVKSGQGVTGSRLMNVDLYRDIEGRYYPYLEQDNQFYDIRSDDRVERITQDQDGSSGVRVESIRNENGGV
jgi:protein-tyrosine phosphatase